MRQQLHRLTDRVPLEHRRLHEGDEGGRLKFVRLGGGALLRQLQRVPSCLLHTLFRNLIAKAAVILVQWQVREILRILTIIVTKALYGGLCLLLSRPAITCLLREQVHLQAPLVYAVLEDAVLFFIL